MKKMALILIISLFLPLSGCKKEQAAVKKTAAAKVQPLEMKKDIKEPEKTKKVEQEVYAYDSKGRRDPFMSLIVVTTQKPTKKKHASPYESYDIDQLTLLAIAWDNEKHYALIMLPDKKSYTITEGMTLGLHGGKVLKITKDMVVIREYTKDYKGNIKPRDFVLKLRKEEGE
jgi:Tfp pilus assembly protein PilP